MLYQTGTNSTTNMSSSIMTVDEANSAKVASMLIGNYTMALTPVRELIVNAIEAIQSVEGGKVEVSIDHDDSQVASAGVFSDKVSHDHKTFKITVADNGIGMSHDFMVNKFSKLTYSTKDSSEDAVGGFGIGSKGIMSISPHAVFRTVKDGEATVCVLSLTTEGVGITTSDPQTTDEPNGTTVTARVSQDDAEAIMGTMGERFIDFLDPDTPLTVTLPDGSTMTPGAQMEEPLHVFTTDDGYTVRLFPGYDYMAAKSITLRSVGMPYPCPFSINIQDIIHQAAADAGLTNDVNSTKTLRAVVDVPPRDIVIHSSRESVVENIALGDKIAESIYGAIHAMACVFVARSKEVSTPGELVDFVKEYQESIFCSTDTRRYARNRMAHSILNFRDEVGYDGINKVLLIPADHDNVHTKYSVYEPVNGYKTIHGMFSFPSHPASLDSLYNSCGTMSEYLDADVHDGVIMVPDVVFSPAFDKMVFGVNIPVMENMSHIDFLQWFADVEIDVLDEDYDKIRKNMMVRGRKICAKNRKGNKKDTPFAFLYSTKENKAVSTSDASGLVEWVAEHNDSHKNHIIVVVDSSTSITSMSEHYGGDTCLGMSKEYATNSSGDVLLIINENVATKKRKNSAIYADLAKAMDHGFTFEKTTYYDVYDKLYGMINHVGRALLMVNLDYRLRNVMVGGSTFAEVVSDYAGFDEEKVNELIDNYRNLNNIQDNDAGGFSVSWSHRDVIESFSGVVNVMRCFIKGRYDRNNLIADHVSDRDLVARMAALHAALNIARNVDFNGDFLDHGIDHKPNNSVFSSLKGQSNEDVTKHYSNCIFTVMDSARKILDSGAIPHAANTSKAKAA